VALETWLWSLQVTITLTEGAFFDFFFNLGLKNCCYGWEFMVNIQVPQKPPMIEKGKNLKRYF